jgi:hypothetical protein
MSIDEERKIPVLAKIIAGIILFTVLGWIVVGYIIAHFVAKFW